MLLALAGCHGDSRLLMQFNVRHLNALCTDLLLLPDTAQDAARRNPFEDKMVQLGIFRTKRVPLTRGRYATVYDVARSDRNAVHYTQHQARIHYKHELWVYPNIGQVCFGKMRPLRIVKITTTGYGEFTAKFL